MNSFKAQLVTCKDGYQRTDPYLGQNVQVQGTEIGGGCKEGCIAFDKSEDLEAPPNSKIQVVFEREGG